MLKNGEIEVNENALQLICTSSRPELPNSHKKLNTTIIYATTLSSGLLCLQTSYLKLNTLFNAPT